ncbi:IclR family transcriptional regulator [Egicoccus halophilus]|uniref:IclR family transcriptional regulator n=1 Tax=Egicoccus halophilus TaxID=1670830 RepID=A0A8J3A8Y8_9ACTN|nr:IclR family transcriptional regulator [Egicoccus halophilus]GGI07137.1 IclR family transcriptional regulator [Egicoccus halophilus]
MGGDQVPGATRALAVLRYLASQPRPVPASAITRALELPRSTTYHLLAALERERFVTRLPEERRYALGVAAFEIGSAYLRHAGLERLARPLLATLVEQAGETGHLGVLDGRETLYLLEHRSPVGDVLVTDVGVRLPAHLTASGRALLSWLPRAQLTALFPTSAALSRRTDRGPGSLAALRRLLTADRARGWAEEDGEVTDGFASVAAAAFDHAARPVAAFAVTFRDRRHDAASRRALASLVSAQAATLTSRLGGSAPGDAP